jgi:hypothetical protein
MCFYSLISTIYFAFLVGVVADNISDTLRKEMTENLLHQQLTINSLKEMVYYILNIRILMEMGVSRIWSF